MYVFTLCVHVITITMQLYSRYTVRSSEIEADGSEKLKRVFIRLHHALALVVLDYSIIPSPTGVMLSGPNSICASPTS